MTRKAILIAIAFLTGLGMAEGQPMSKQSPRGAYAIPYASQSNRVELEVVNSTSGPLKDVAVQLNGSPIWLTFETTTASVGVLKPGESRTALFTFDLDEKAPAGEATELTFDISSAIGQLES
ncbi:MAG: NEW3 domain-containing protein, partial [Rhodothermales bacterium]